MIIAIDGPAGSGKSTIANVLAERLGFTKLDTGAMFRTVAFICHDEAIDLDDEQAVVQRACALTISFREEQSTTHVFADGRDVTGEIRTSQTDRIVSKVSAYPGVRQALLRCQREFARGRNVVAEGRDIGTVVFPDAEVKVFLTADPAERARRRVLQRHGQTVVNSEALASEIEETLRDLEARDALDSARAAAPLCAAPDAVHIDSTSSTIEQIVDKIARLVEAVE